MHRDNTEMTVQQKKKAKAVALKINIFLHISIRKDQFEVYKQYLLSWATKKDFGGFALKPFHKVLVCQTGQVLLESSCWCWIKPVGCWWKLSTEAKVMWVVFSISVSLFLSISVAQHVGQGRGPPTRFLLVKRKFLLAVAAKCLLLGQLLSLCKSKSLILQVGNSEV